MDELQHTDVNQAAEQHSQADDIEKISQEEELAHHQQRGLENATKQLRQGTVNAYMEF
jgi:hypothetical protein